MLNYYITVLKNWTENTLPSIINEQNFLLIVGSLFLLGSVTKWLVLRNYTKLIRKAENVEHTRNVTIRQIKTKYDSIKQVYGKVENPMFFIQRSLNKCKVFGVNAGKISNIINWCAILIMAVSAFVSLQIYNGESGKQAWVEYLVIGTVVAVSLEMVSKSFPVYEKKMELSYILMEVLESGNIDKVRDRESLLETEPERDTSSENREEEFSKERQEQVLNQVIGEFLQ